MKIITKSDLIPLRHLDIIKIKTAPTSQRMNNDIGILSKIAEYDKELFEDIELKETDYYDKNDKNV